MISDMRTVPPALETSVKLTPLNALHRARGARMAPFAGYEMPIYYSAGIISEHLHTRSAAGLFDVSHMGQLTLRPRSGRMEDVAHALETLVPVDIVGLGAGRQRYALFTNEAGGILDDLMCANLGDHLFLVVNASRKDADEALLHKTLGESCSIARLNDRALLALQGPKAESVLRRFSEQVTATRFMSVLNVALLGHDCIVSRSGYTGEDGFEISVPAVGAETLACALLENPAVALIGLGARDSLRLEAGLCLYGSDLDATTTPVEAGLEWAIQKVRRNGGARAGGFPGADLILGQLVEGPARRRVGLRPEGRAPIRHGVPLFRDRQDAIAIGEVTSGGFGPSIEAPIAMGYVAREVAADNTLIYAELRGQRIPVRICQLPFVSSRYKRN